MKLTKLLIPSLSLVAIAPTSMLLTSCSIKNSTPFKIDIDLSDLKEENNYVEVRGMGSYGYYVYEPFNVTISYANKSKSFATSDKVHIEANDSDIDYEIISGGFKSNSAWLWIDNPHYDNGSWSFQIVPGIGTYDNEHAELLSGDHVKWSFTFEIEFMVNGEDCGKIEGAHVSGELEWKE